MAVRIPVQSKTRLLGGSEHLIESLTSVLDHRLEYNRECMLYFGPHNLAGHSLSSIFQSEHDTNVPDQAHIGLNSDEKRRLAEVLGTVCTQVGADHSVVWDCFDHAGGMLPIAAEGPGPNANEETLAVRWNARSLRMYVDFMAMILMERLSLLILIFYEMFLSLSFSRVVRRLAQHAHDLIELRVACVGNGKVKITYRASKKPSHSQYFVFRSV